MAMVVKSHRSKQKRGEKDRINRINRIKGAERRSR
jgi:hypothetical protein